jgi:lysophospholipase L1-like esterase
LDKSNASFSDRAIMSRILPRSRVLFIGDSITDAGRDPSGEATPWGAPGTGRGYVSLIEAWFGATRPADQIRVVNRGTSGHTVRDLAARWQADVLATPPDWLSIMIGINDVWRQFDTPLRTDLHVRIDEYRATLTELVNLSRPHIKGLVLATPYVIEPNRADSMRAMMDAYGAVVRDLAAANDAVFVDTQAAFDAVTAHTHPMTLAWDRIHPNTTGHLVLARAFLSALVEPV